VINSRLLVTVVVAVAVFHCRRRRLSPVIVVVYTVSGCRLPTSQGYATSPVCLGGEWALKFTKHLIVSGMPLEFATYFELFVVLHIRIVVVPNVNEFCVVD